MSGVTDWRDGHFLGGNVKRDASVLDYRTVDFIQMRREGWLVADVITNLPSPNSYKDCLIITISEGFMSVKQGGWHPTDGYTKGEFRINDRVIPIKEICLYRTLHFIPTLSIKEYVELDFKNRELNGVYP